MLRETGFLINKANWKIFWHEPEDEFRLLISRGVDVKKIPWCESAVVKVLIYSVFVTLICEKTLMCMLDTSRS